MFTGAVFNNGPVKEDFTIWAFTSGNSPGKGWWSEVKHRNDFKRVVEGVIGEREITLSIPRVNAMQYFPVKTKYPILRIFTHEKIEKVNGILEFLDVVVNNHYPVNSKNRAPLKQEQMQYMHNKKGFSRDEIMYQQIITLFINPESGSWSPIG